MRVCDICRGGKNIASIMIIEGTKATGTEIEEGLDCCEECRGLIKSHDWLSLATRSGQSVAEDYVKRGTDWLTAQLVPEVKKLFTDKVKKESPPSNTSQDPQA